MSEDQEISCSVIDSHVSESNSNAPTPRDDLTIIAQKPTIIGESNSSSDNSGKYFTIIVENASIVTQSMIKKEQNLSCFIQSLNHSEVKERIEKFMNEVVIDAIKRLKNKPDRTDGIPNDVLDYLASKGIKNMKDRNTKGSDKNTNDDVIRSENFQLISVNIDDIPLDKVDVVHGNNYTSIKVKKDFGISQLTKNNKLIWETDNSSIYVKQFLLYNEGENYHAFLLLNDMSLVSLERTGWFKTWKRKTKNFDIIYLTAIKKNYCSASVFEFLTEFLGHFLIIFMPFTSTEIYYKYSLVFKYNDDGNYPLFLSVDLLTGQIMVQLCHIEINHNVARFQLGHELSDVEKRGEKDVPFLENIIEFMRIIEPNEMYGIVSEKSTSELSDGYTNSTMSNYSNSDGSLTPENQQKFDSESVNKSYTIEPLLKRIKLDINNSEYEKYYKKKISKNFRYFSPTNHSLFDKVLDGKKVIWKKKKNRLLAKEVYFYFDDNDKWVIILLDNNTLKFYHKPSDSEEWTDVSTKMLSTDILKVINSNHRKQSRMDLNFDFFSSFCLIDLGNAVSVGYKDYVQYFKEYGIDHSVCLFLDILTKSVHFMEFILNIQNQLTNQH
uniref:Uncharacterized protein n=1 Tax=Theileria annulata TaxID=5874 RepID=A0A3B0MQN7_THEAN